MMKINRLEAHDRLLHLKKDQAHVITQGAEDCLKKNSLCLELQARSPYVYIFGHPRLHDNGRDTRMIWQGRLTKPNAQTNSYLFRAKSYGDILEVCWFLPPRETWGQFKKGNVTESTDVLWSIHQFENNREKLEQPFEDDLPYERVKEILQDIDRERDQDRRIKKLYPKQDSSEAYQAYDS